MTLSCSHWKPLSSSWLPTVEEARPSAFRTSTVGRSSVKAELNSDAPMLSPAERSRTLPAPLASRTPWTVVANSTVLYVVASALPEPPSLEIRPW